MVVHNLDIVGIPVSPHKTNAPLIVDANAVLPFSISLQRFQVIARRRSQIAEFRGDIQLTEFPLPHPLDISKPPDPPPSMKLFSLFRSKGLDHLVKLITLCVICQAL